jgi:hypothetical protein
MHVSQRRACEALGVSRSTQRYEAKIDTADESRWVARMHELVRRYLAVRLNRRRREIIRYDSDPLV